MISADFEAAAAVDMTSDPVQSKKAKQSKRDKSTGDDSGTNGHKVKDKDSDKWKREKKEKKEKKRMKKAREAGGGHTADSANGVKPDGDQDSVANGSDSEQKTKERRESREERKKRKSEKKQKGEKKRKHPEAENGADNGASVERPAKKFKSDKATKQNGSSYQETASLSALSQSKVDDFLQANLITVNDGTGLLSHLRPIIDFDHLPRTSLLAKNPFSAFKSPTPIQASSWPFTLSGRDVVGVAETGSGKTMAFALPCVYSVLAKRETGITAAIVAPTRELAMQTHEQISQLAELVGIKCICIYGGASKDDQRRLLRKSPDVVVATPGRLKDFMAEGSCDLSKVRFAVLDEADRMLDKGFEDDIKQILGSMNPRGQRQTLMFTATWPTSVQALASTMMLDPVKITIGSAKEQPDGPTALQANMRITQSVEVMESYEKEGRLIRLIQEKQRMSRGELHRILVFCLYKKEAARIESFLRYKGITVGGIHGDMNQSNRTAALAAFKSGTVPVLVATDVAARGLDIPEVKLVVNCTVGKPLECSLFTLRPS